MTVESATYISQLNTANPTGADAKSEGDDHLRLLKSVLRAQFPNFGAAALTASNTQLDKLVTTFSVNTGAPSSVIQVDGSGKVGINVAPSVSFHVQDATGEMRIQNTTSSTAILSFRNSATTNVCWIGTTGDDVRINTGLALRGVFDLAGNFIKNVNASAPSLTANNQMVFSLPSDTQLRVSVRSSDGVTRTANFTLA